jgi:YjjG family noncanonical pyrimidine nucleotidase
MNTYRCVFFDLDHTLWDYETNCEESLLVLFDRHRLLSLGAVAFPEFLKNFIAINNEMWDLHDRGLLSRDAIRNDRFHRVMLKSGIDHYELSLQVSKDYLSESPRGRNVIPHALDVLQYLHEKKYPVYIITNGFDEIQSTKAKSSGIDRYIDKIITSEEAGHKKPAQGIFDYALSLSGFGHHEAIMIGDNLITDIGGARNAGISQVFFNPRASPHEESVTYEIKSLTELKNIL